MTAIASHLPSSAQEQFKDVMTKERPSWNSGSFRRRWITRRSLRLSMLLHKKVLMALVGVVIIITTCLIWPIASRIQWRPEQTWYEIGWYGVAPVRKYHSLDQTVTQIEFLRQDSRCSQDYIFLAPRGPNVDSPGGIIVDANGELIWRQPTLGGDTQDFRPQRFHDQDVLTFWSGHVGSGRKQGAWYIVGSSSFTFGYPKPKIPVITDATYSVMSTIKSFTKCFLAVTIRTETCMSSPSRLKTRLSSPCTSRSRLT